MAGTSTSIKLKSRAVDWEPFAPAAAPPRPLSIGEIEKHWVRCDGYYLLKDEIHRYCCGLIRGQSFLVAGHRGAGKTLLTHLAVQINRWAILDPCLADSTSQAKPRAIPLVVHIHGPDLLAGFDQDNNEIKTSAMSEILLALQKAFTQELLIHFRQAFQNDKPRGRDLVELTRELDNNTSAQSALRFWERFGVADCGILAKVLESSVLERQCSGSQALQELHILESLNHWAEVLRGKKAQPSPETKPEWWQILLDPKLARSIVPIVAPIVSVVAAVLAAGRLPDSKNPLFQWIGPAVIFFVTLSLTRQILLRHHKGFPETPLEDQKTVPDLGRALPLVVGRMHQAGFAPIFVVDELDKVDDLKVRLRHFMRHLKYFATDEAFFCFLTDRKYFEEFEANLERAEYPEEQTYFGQRILIHYRPEDVAKYLDSLFAAEKSDWKQEWLMRRVAMQRSNFHPDLLRAYLNRSRARPNELEIEDGNLWVTPGHRFALFLNIATKVIYDSSGVQHRLRQYRHFSAWVLDALYFLQDAWREGKTEVQLEQKALRKFLAERVGVAEKQIAVLPEDNADRKVYRPRGGLPERPMLSISEFDALMELVRRLDAYMLRPWELLQDFLKYYTKGSQDDNDNLQDILISCCTLMMQTPLFHKPGYQQGRRIWKFDYFGRPEAAGKRNESWRYFEAIRANSFEETMERCHPNVDELWSQLRRLGVTTCRVRWVPQYLWGEPALKVLNRSANEITGPEWSFIFETTDPKLARKRFLQLVYRSAITGVLNHPDRGAVILCLLLGRAIDSAKPVLANDVEALEEEYLNTLTLSPQNLEKARSIMPMISSAGYPMACLAGLRQLADLIHPVATSAHA